VVDNTDTFFYRFRVLVGSTFVVLGILLLPLLLSLIWTKPKVHAANTSSDSSVTSLEDSPNIITSGLFSAGDKIEKTTNSTEQTINNSFNFAAKNTVAVAAQSGKFIGHSVGYGATFVGQSIGNSFAFSIRLTGNTFGFIADTPPVSTLIKPANKVAVPVINTNAPAIAATTQVSPPTPPANPASSNFDFNSEASWPIHGVITTDFGVPHWPYQPTHTGLDISDGRPAGTTPIKSFKPGRVVEVVHSNVSLGNHVVVDHGGGITSVYGHMAFTSVQVGQQVDKSTTLGYEGSTGASTGTHLHFEIRLNGQPMDPRKYVSGHP
jgi:hypothetical protein